MVVVCADEGEAERMARDLAALSGEEVRTLSAREFTFHNAAVVSRQYEHRRLSTLRRWRRGSAPCWSVRWSLFSSAPFPKPC